MTLKKLLEVVSNWWELENPCKRSYKHNTADVELCSRSSAYTAIHLQPFVWIEIADLTNCSYTSSWEHLILSAMKAIYLDPGFTRGERSPTDPESFKKDVDIFMNTGLSVKKRSPGMCAFQKLISCTDIHERYIHHSLTNQIDCLNNNTYDTITLIWRERIENLTPTTRINILILLESLKQFTPHAMLSQSLAIRTAIQTLDGKNTDGFKE